MPSLRALLTARKMRRQGTAPVPFAPLPRPDEPVCVVGDIHGRLDLLKRMLAQIEECPDAAKARIIIAGDMIDRGPQSAAVVRLLHRRCRADPTRTFCLMGNHERMMLDFLQDPERNGPRWLASGGSDTLASFGIAIWARRDSLARPMLVQQAEALRAALTPDELSWLQSLPLYWQERDLAVAHAGADPTRAFNDQTAESLLWGCRHFYSKRRSDGLWVVHGHTVVEKAHATEGRIAVDTGAWQSGCLSAVWIDGSGLTFLTARDRG